MRVFIQQQAIDYKSDYSPNNQKWYVKNTIAAYSIQPLNGQSCFIKRSQQKPPGWKLLKRLKNRNNTQCPLIHDAVSTKEKGKTTYYYFTEKLEGYTLSEAIGQGIFIDIAQLLKDICQALHFLHQQKFWMSDLNEENIFRTKDGRFYLIDLDSCYPHTIPPHPEENKLGGLPGASQSLAKSVHGFYHKILQNNTYHFSTLSGANLNYLQLVFIATKVHYFYQTRLSNPSFAYIRNNFRKISLPHFLIKKNARYCKGLFTTALQQLLNPAMVLVLIDFLAIKEEDTAPKPVIQYFKSSATELIEGTWINLSWNVENAQTIWLKTPNERKIIPAQGRELQLPTSDTVYQLIAKNAVGKQVTKKIAIQVQKKKRAVAATLVAWLVAASFILSISVGTYWYHSHKQYERTLQLGNELFTQKEYGKALRKYEAAARYWNTDRVQHKILQTEQASRHYFNVQLPKIQGYIERGKVYPAQKLISQLKQAGEYTPVLNKEVEKLEKKLEELKQAIETNHLK